ncbi:MAG: hypothetical protein N2C14_15160, partial [Planctomycetales bacterium]
MIAAAGVFNNMIIRFLCPLGHRLIVPQQQAGNKIQCPVCYNLVSIPVRDPHASGKAKKAWNATPTQEAQAAREAQAAVSSPTPAVSSPTPAAQTATPAATLPQPVPATPAPIVAAPQAQPNPASAAGPFDSMPEINQLNVSQPAATPQPAAGEFPFIQTEKANASESLAARASEGKLQTVYLLAAGLAAVVVLSAIPAMGNL